MVTCKYYMITIKCVIFDTCVTIDTRRSLRGDMLDVYPCSCYCRFMIYFVQSSCSERFIKIGYLGDKDTPNNRFSVLQANNPHALHVLGIMNGDIEAERHLHSRFLYARYRAEWFWPDSQLLDFISNNTYKYERVDRRKRIPAAPSCY